MWLFLLSDETSYVFADTCCVDETATSAKRCLLFSPSKQTVEIMLFFLNNLIFHTLKFISDNLSFSDIHK